MVKDENEETHPKRHTERHVLDPKYVGGPLGLGDPDDQSLRKVEKDVMVPKIIRDRTRDEKCSHEYNSFRACSKAAGLAMVVRCRKENNTMQNCYAKWYTDPDFVQECTEQYLRERSEFRRSGIQHKREKPGPIPDEYLERYGISRTEDAHQSKAH